MDHLIAPPLNSHYEGAYSAETKAWNWINALDKADHIVTVLRDRSVSDVLEVGCGTGAVLAAVRARGIGQSHVGLDITDPDLHRVPEAAGLDLRIYDGRDLPFPAGHFDLVYASHVLEHLIDPRYAIREILRVARKFVYLEVPCELHARTNLASIQRSLDIGHINSYTPESFQLLLESTGTILECLQVFDHSLAIYEFGGSKVRAVVRAAIRGTFLKISPRIATKVFCYHCGALALV